MILKALICSALILAVAQVSRRDRYAALIFLTPVVVMNVFGDSVPGVWYYFACAFLDRTALSVLVSSGMFPELARAAFVAVALSFFGWVLWVAYLPPTIYNNISLLYYVWVLWILFTRSGIHAGAKRVVEYFSGGRMVYNHNLQRVVADEARGES